VAELPPPTLSFPGIPPDVGQRLAHPPDPLPPVGDDFDWQLRDYDSFSTFMLEELAARFPDRSTWTEGDFELVLLEAFAAVLDQLSDMLDRVSSETYLETARRPESVRRLLSMIGYDAVTAAAAAGQIKRDDPRPLEEALDAYWLANPSALEAARRAGPPAVRTQRRMVTLGDYATQLEQHPLVRRAGAWSAWGGSWTVVRTRVLAWQAYDLDQTGIDYSPIESDLTSFHAAHGLPGLGLPLPPLDASPTIREVLNPYLDAYRMAGQEVTLETATRVPLQIALTVGMSDNYFRSEVRLAVAQALGTDPGGLFAPGALNFGQAVHWSDVLSAVGGLAGVGYVLITSFKRLGLQYAEQTGQIALADNEIACCDNDPQHPENGYYVLTLDGGRAG
jgi:hypothetical protein